MSLAMSCSNLSEIEVIILDPINISTKVFIDWILMSHDDSDNVVDKR